MGEGERNPWQGKSAERKGRRGQDWTAYAGLKTSLAQMYVGWKTAVPHTAFHAKHGRLPEEGETL